MKPRSALIKMDDVVKAQVEQWLNSR